MLNKQGLNDEEMEKQSHIHLEDSSSLGLGDSDPECGDGEVMVREAVLGLSSTGWRRSRRGHCQPGGWGYGPGIMEGATAIQGCGQGGWSHSGELGPGGLGCMAWALPLIRSQRCESHKD